MVIGQKSTISRREKMSTETIPCAHPENMTSEHLAIARQKMLNFEGPKRTENMVNEQKRKVHHTIHKGNNHLGIAIHKQKAAFNFKHLRDIPQAEGDQAAAQSRDIPITTWSEAKTPVQMTVECIPQKADVSALQYLLPRQWKARME